MRLAIYARVSTEDQAKSGYSLPSQIAACRERAADFAASEIIEYVDDGYTGSTMDRPALRQLRDDVGAGTVGAIIVLDPDRLSRNLVQLLLLTDEFERAHVKLNYVNMEWQNTPEGRLFLSLRGAVAEFERAKISERTQRGRRQKALSGRIANAPVHLHGYRWDPVTDTLNVVEEEAAAIRRIFELYVQQRLGTGLVARQMNQEGWPAPEGQRWHQATVRRILSNPACIGLLRQFKREQTVHVPCPAIVPQETYAEAQRLLAQNRKRNPGRAAAQSEYSLLAGKVFCGLCGNRMYLTAGFWGKKRYGYYVCQQRRASYANGTNRYTCMNPPHRLERADEAAWNAIRELLDMPDDSWRRRLLAALDAHSGTRAERERLLREVDNLQAARERLLRFAAINLVSEAEAEAALRENQSRLAELRARLATLGGAGLPADPDQLLDKALKRIQTLRRAAATATSLKERREIIAQVVDRVSIAPDCRLILEPRGLVPEAGV